MYAEKSTFYIVSFELIVSRDQVRKVKAIWYTMNKFKKTETGLLHAEGWCPKLQLNEVDRALKRGAVC